MPIGALAPVVLGAEAPRPELPDPPQRRLGEQVKPRAPRDSGAVGAPGLRYTFVVREKVPPSAMEQLPEAVGTRHLSGGTFLLVDVDDVDHLHAFYARLCHLGFRVMNVAKLPIVQQA